MLAFTGALLMHEADHQRRRGADPAIGIAERGMHHGRRITFAASDGGQA